MPTNRRRPRTVFRARQAEFGPTVAGIVGGLQGLWWDHRLGYLLDRMKDSAGTSLQLTGYREYVAEAGIHVKHTVCNTLGLPLMSDLPAPFHVLMGIAFTTVVGFAVGPLVRCATKGMSLPPPSSRLTDQWAKVVEGNEGGRTRPFGTHCLLRCLLGRNLLRNCRLSSLQSGIEMERLVQHCRSA